MNQNNYLLLGLIIILAMGAGYYYSQNRNADNPSVSLESEQVLSSESQLEVVEESPTSVAEGQMNVPEGAIEYEISGTPGVSYVAQKRFMNKPDAEVVGSSNQVNGKGWFNPADNTGYLRANLNFSSLATDTPKRDEDVKALFSVDLITYEANLQNENIVMGQPFENIAVPSKLTVNDVTRDVTFTVSGNITESVLSAQGSANFNISDFGINPPSMVSVFTVDDPIEVRFDITADRAN